ncbi:MAG: sialate O-acetylesterase, partial [Candidatus Aminicenantes bacterium]|nr:sialate O-acetylesterase [Candidatus Aminicenantes bacterium]
MSRSKSFASIFLVLVAILSLGLVPALSAEIKLPAIIGDHMVVQQDKPVAIWGWAGKNEQVTVRFNGQEKQSVAGADGA